MLTCEQLTRLATDFLEGDLAFGERLRLRLHLAICSHCREYLRQLRLAVRTLGLLPEEPIPEETLRRLLGYSTRVSRSRSR